MSSQRQSPELQPPEPPILGGWEERRGAAPLCTPRGNIRRGGFETRLETIVICSNEVGSETLHPPIGTMYSTERACHTGQ